MTYKKRIALFWGIDSIFVLTAIYISYYTLHPNVQIFSYPSLLVSSITLLISHHLFSTVYKLYQKSWRFASVGELISIAKIVTLTIIIVAIVQQVVLGDIIVRALMITWMLHIILIGGSRFSYRVLRNLRYRPDTSRKRTLIVGAGSAGTMVTRQLLQNAEAELIPVAFIDDDIRKHHLDILGISVLGGISELGKIVEEKNIENILIAVPSLSKKELQPIINECNKTTAKIQIMPMLEDIMVGKVAVSEFRDVSVEDLLGREPVELDISSISKTITGKVVLVTGAGGSIGSEICRQISNFSPKTLLLLGHGENSIYTIDMELRNNKENNFEIIPVIADVQDRERIFEVMDKFKPDVVYHAAAHKHVPLMEYNPKEAIKNNIIGTKNVAEGADVFGVNTFVLVSSDKAVNPTNIMGATKRFAEIVIQNLSKCSNTKFVAVRFGNVLGSRGSVIPLFKKQILAGGPVTVTHPDMTRYFMTIPEASRLVIQAGTLARGGEIFVLDMGEPVKIVDLAKNLIMLSGYTIDEIGINFSGIRPGEKMYEELLNENEMHKEQVFPKIHIGKAVLLDMKIVLDLIGEFEDMELAELKSYLLGYANKKYVESLVEEALV
ncbi:polysaccharide biosynthesis protein [Bacillus sp. B1-b2]|uniref:polysaccharide biosynthesis protein n=1 Tax=Bacillus sp. B1-b2 TaxID=2653201 RepID=UPI001261E220|nr:nucleoside-diphosphate sugar epimerase/dehydratase [Bacillus sp. B1-b2]KAB7671703.1 polysaccharide biosynthesis protein [Bacillus sp. B1-b2]